MPSLHGKRLCKWSKKFNFSSRYWIWSRLEPEQKDGKCENIYRLGRISPLGFAFFAFIFGAAEVIDWGCRGTSRVPSSAGEKWRLKVPFTFLTTPIEREPVREDNFSKTWKVSSQCRSQTHRFAFRTKFNQLLGQTLGGCDYAFQFGWPLADIKIEKTFCHSNPTSWNILMLINKLEWNKLQRSSLENVLTNQLLDPLVTWTAYVSASPSAAR